MRGVQVRFISDISFGRLSASGQRGVAIALVVSQIAAAGAAVSAQQAAATPREFAAADTRTKGAILAQLIRHEGSVPPADVAAIILSGLNDPTSAVREGALAAVVSRAAAPNFDRSPSGSRDWIADHDAIQRLRPAVTACLRDDDEEVREAAVRAMVSLDFSIATGPIGLSEATERQLVATYYADPSGRVRATIVGGLASDEGSRPRNVGRMLLDAFDDPDARVRHAASSGAGKLDRGVAVSLLVRQLADVDRSVRAQSAAQLSMYGAAASSALPQIEQALAHERDPQVRFLLEVAVSNIRR
jgi:hypothetical protein